MSIQTKHMRYTGGKMFKRQVGQAGFTLVELSVSVVILSIVVVSMFGLLVTLADSAITAKRRAVALSIATNQMESLKSLPYDSLIVIGGSIIGTGTVPLTQTKTVNNVPYIIKTSIDFVDDAYDDCGPIYDTVALKLSLCRGSTASTPTDDSNYQDYKIVHVVVMSSSGTQLAAEDTEVAAKVSETASNTGAFIVTVIDGSGAPVQGATVNVTNSTVSPVVNATDTTDSNGRAIFYKAPPDSGNDYVVTATKNGYSSLTTIPVSGTLQPVYANQKVVTQQASYVTLNILPQGANSLVVETTDTSGNPLGNAKIYVKGGYKKYTATSDTSYYYDNPSAVTTDASGGTIGQGGINNLVPGTYTFCGDDGSVSCTIGGTTYYLAAAIPYGGSSVLSPVTVPIYSASSPPSVTFPYGSTNYLQKVRLMLTTRVNFPRVYSLSPADVSISAPGLNAFTFTVNGQKLPCSTTASSCATTVTFTQGVTTYTASCTGTTAGLQLSCSANLTGITVGTAQLTVSNTGGTLSLPITPLQGGLVVAP